MIYKVRVEYDSHIVYYLVNADDDEDAETQVAKEEGLIRVHDTWGSCRIITYPLDLCRPTYLYET